MNDSQSSDLLSESTDIFLNTPPDAGNTDDITYDALVSSTKNNFSAIRKEIKKSYFSDHFSTLLEDCSTCISQSLDLIVDILSDKNTNITKLANYMEDTVSLLQLLSDLVKNIIETVTMACSSFKMFPIFTGRIIMLVFSHCKDSESVYGSNLSKVEKQLKDLFRTCHELQLTYLIVMEKHFTFDLTERQEQDVLVEALDINLKIGEIVQSLDVKTMAEQWKAYTVICDKYSNCLKDKYIYRDCTRILCTMIRNNIKTALEEGQEEKIVIRSLKVSSFTLKILVKVCGIFRIAVNKDHESILELLLYIYLHNEAYLETICKKSSQFVNIFNNNVTSAVSSLLNELLLDETYVNCLCYYDVTALGKNETLIGLIMLVMSIVRTLLSGNKPYKISKERLIDVIYSFLPYCHIWFNLSLKFKCESKSSKYQSYGLCEHILTHTTALAASMSCEEINVLETKMIEAILGTDCTSAMFSVKLWVMLARISPRQFLLTQVISLCKIYQKYENNKLCEPQKLHLTHTMHRLYREMAPEDKIRVYKMFSIQDDSNITLWAALKVNNLPTEVQWSAENIVIEKLRRAMENTGDDVMTLDVLIDFMNLASTCSLNNRDDETEELLGEAWKKACPKTIQIPINVLNTGNLWYYRYVEALANFAYSMEKCFYNNSVNLVKVLHTISSIIQVGCKEFKLVLINVLCKLANVEVCDINKRLVDTILIQTYRELFQDTDWNIKHKLFHVLGKHRSNSLDKIITKVVAEEDIQETWYHFLRYGRLKKIENLVLKEQLLLTMQLKYCHKCIESEELRYSGSEVVQKSSSNNFDLIDMDTLFDTESDTEPATKKAKLNNSEVEEIISRLEIDASLLCKIKENVFSDEYKNRLKNLSNKLNTIVN